MACNHERIKCTDNVFYCAVCGAVVEMPMREEKPKVNLSRSNSQPTAAPAQPIAPPPPPAQTASPTLPIADIDWENDFNF